MRGMRHLLSTAFLWHVVLDPHERLGHYSYHLTELYVTMATTAATCQVVEQV